MFFKTLVHCFPEPISFSLRLVVREEEVVDPHTLLLVGVCAFDSVHLFGCAYVPYCLR